MKESAGEGGEEKSPERSSASPQVPDPWICPSRRDSLGNRYVTVEVHGVVCGYPY